MLYDGYVGGKGSRLDRFLGFSVLSIESHTDAAMLRLARSLYDVEFTCTSLQRTITVLFAIIKATSSSSC